MMQTQTARPQAQSAPARNGQDNGQDAGDPGEPERADVPARLERLRHVIEHAAHLLPAQGPITSFVHHNTLHAFEDLPFDEGVAKAARIFGCQPYLAEDRYRELHARGRIRTADLRAILEHDLGERAPERFLNLVDLGSRLDLRLAMLEHPMRLAPSAELRWLVAETDALRRFREDVPQTVENRAIEQTRHWVLRDVLTDVVSHGCSHGSARGAADEGHHTAEALAGLIERFGSKVERWSEARWEEFHLRALWRACRRGIHGLPAPPAPAPPVRHRDLLLDAVGADSDRLVNEVLIRFCAAFLDQGMAAWPLPLRDQGFYHSFLALYGRAVGLPERWQCGLRRELSRLADAGVGALASIEESLALLGVTDGEREAYTAGTLLALRGWAGMVRQLEVRPDAAPHPAPPGSLVEYLAVRLILERLALAHLAKESLGFTGPLAELRQAARARIPRHEAVGVEQRAFLVFQLAQVMGWTPDELFALSRSDWAALVAEVEAFSALERRRVFQHAYERRYFIQALDAFAAHGRRKALPRTQRPRPRFQIVCCIDDREESFRRHLEEVAPDVETFGAAGFFAVAMHYRGAADAHFTALCPAVMRPEHWVVEGIAYNFEEEHRRRTRTRKMLGTASLRVHVGSRTLTGGALTALLGSLATAPLVARVLFPRLTARIGRRFGRIVEPPAVRQLVLERLEPEPAPREGHFGYTVVEMAGIVERLLRDIGLTSNFARLMVVTGHGSSSVNNPHESAYNCGACAGQRGGPNARAFAQMANDPRVRAAVAARGLKIPPDMVFVGAFHNTCDDSVTYFDLDRLPHTHKRDFDQARRDIEAACGRNAHERCRRFESAPLDLSFEAALRHVERRSEDLAQARPEYNHAANALTVVGRRARTRGLFLDRRAFLACYDPTQDDAEHTVLARILAPVIPVCAGISLEYYFSCVDPAGYGCNNKLPHNVASLLGVMLGAASDLQPGLNTQMIEIHEPIRQLFIIETTPAAMLDIMQRNPDIGRVCRNGWVRIATLDPDSSVIHVYRDGAFERYHPETTELPRVASSVDWYRGWRDHLGFAAIGAGESGAGESGAGESRGGESRGGENIEPVAMEAGRDEVGAKA